MKTKQENLGYMIVQGRWRGRKENNGRRSCKWKDAIQEEKIDSWVVDRMKLTNSLFNQQGHILFHTPNLEHYLSGVTQVG